MSAGLSTSVLNKYKEKADLGINLGPVGIESIPYVGLIPIAKFPKKPTLLSVELSTSILDNGKEMKKHGTLNAVQKHKKRPLKKHTLLSAGLSTSVLKNPAIITESHEESFDYGMDNDTAGFDPKPLLRRVIPHISDGYWADTHEDHIAALANFITLEQIVH